MVRAILRAEERADRAVIAARCLPVRESSESWEKLTAHAAEPRTQEEKREQREEKGAGRAMNAALCPAVRRWEEGRRQVAPSQLRVVKVGKVREDQ